MECELIEKNEEKNNKFPIKCCSTSNTNNINSISNLETCFMSTEYSNKRVYEKPDLELKDNLLAINKNLTDKIDEYEYCK